MINKIISVLKKADCQKKAAAEKEYLLGLIDETKQYLSAVESGFNETTDEDLTEYYIYEKRAAEIRYKYLLKLCGSIDFSSRPQSISALFRAIS